MKAGRTFELLAENALDDFTVASPSAAGGQIFLRTKGCSVRAWNGVSRWPGCVSDGPCVPKRRRRHSFRSLCAPLASVASTVGS